MSSSIALLCSVVASDSQSSASSILATCARHSISSDDQLSSVQRRWITSATSSARAAIDRDDSRTTTRMFVEAALHRVLAGRTDVDDVTGGGVGSIGVAGAAS